MGTGKIYAPPDFAYTAYEQSEAITIEISGDLSEDGAAMIFR